MNLIGQSFKDWAWYWKPSQATGADGVPVFEPPQLLQWPNGGRWDDNPTRLIGPNGEIIQISARFTTAVPIVAGGWLLKAGDEGGRDPGDGSAPSQFALAREINAVSVAKNRERTVTYYTGMIK